MPMRRIDLYFKKATGQPRECERAYSTPCAVDGTAEPKDSIQAFVESLDRFKNDVETIALAMDEVCRQLGDLADVLS
jgi:hypothetical protein